MLTSMSQLQWTNCRTLETRNKTPFKYILHKLYSNFVWTTEWGGICWIIKTILLMATVPWAGQQIPRCNEEVNGLSRHLNSADPNFIGQAGGSPKHGGNILTIPIFHPFTPTYTSMLDTAGTIQPSVVLGLCLSSFDAWWGLYWQYAIRNMNNQSCKSLWHFKRLLSWWARDQITVHEVCRGTKRYPHFKCHSFFRF